MSNNRRAVIDMVTDALERYDESGAEIVAAWNEFNDASAQAGDAWIKLVKLAEAAGG